MVEADADSLPRVAAAVVVHQHRVLLLRRRASENQLSWQFPAGKVEPGESAEQAAVRGTREETGLTVVAVKLLGERVHPVTARHIMYAACGFVGGTAHVAAPDEVAEVAWVAHADIPRYVPYGLFGPVQRHLDTYLLG